MATNFALHVKYETSQRVLLGTTDEYFSGAPCCTLAYVGKVAACYDSDSTTVYMNITVDSCKSRLGILFKQRSYAFLTSMLSSLFSSPGQKDIYGQ
jgi:hypothetical protein